jgi:DNA processing protein
MTPEGDVAAVVALLRAATLPLHVYSELLEEAGSGVATLEREHGLLAQSLVEAAALEIVEWERDGIRVIPITDPEYPANLRSVHDRVPLLFVAGALQPRDTRSVAVIGTRRPSATAEERTRAIVSGLVDHGYTVASGLALGIDTVAHSTALERGGRTIAVIGTGLRHSYPAQNAHLQKRIAAEGAVISQFWPDTPPTRRTFPQRNATMSGLALANVVVEASETSGARTQARLALAHGRPVLLLESLLEQRWARELAARPGAHVVGSPAAVADVVDRLTAVGTLVS